jgi:hypothetical protein
MPKEVIPKPIPKKAEYTYAGKETISEIIGRSIPKQLIPTKRVGTIFGIIILAVIILALFQFPYSSLMSGNTDVTINIGYPWTFIEFDLSGETTPKITGLILDILLYLILAYAIDISINLILKNPLLKSKDQLKQKPAVFKDQKPSIAEKVTDKVISKQSKKI